VRVVLDAGHGGGDSGAVNHALAIRESDINLAVVRLAVAFGSDGPHELHATRLNDEYLTLSERCDLANIMGADLFVSVHSNSCGISEVRGFEAFHCQGSVRGQQLARSLSTEIMNVLMEIEEGEAIFRGVKSAHFFVLEHTIMPAALVELGFVSNDNEAKMLTSVLNQQKLARALLAGLIEV